MIHRMSQNLSRHCCALLARTIQRRVSHDKELEAATHPQCTIQQTRLSRIGGLR